jgi:hypothetical protein
VVLKQPLFAARTYSWALDSLRRRSAHTRLKDCVRPHDNLHASVQSIPSLRPGEPATQARTPLEEEVSCWCAHAMLPTHPALNRACSRRRAQRLSCSVHTGRHWRQAWVAYAWCRKEAQALCSKPSWHGGPKVEHALKSTCTPVDAASKTRNLAQPLAKQARSRAAVRQSSARISSGGPAAAGSAHL